MKRITDKQRLDFLSKQNWTRWVGYTDPKGCGWSVNGGPYTWKPSCTTWPVFPGMDLRKEIDQAIEQQRHCERRALSRSGEPK